MGIYATGQAYEQLILHLLGHPLPEARRYGGLILDAIKAVMPSFVARVERPERGGEWVALPRAPPRGGRALGRAARPRPRRRRGGPPVGAAAARRRRRGRCCSPRCCSRPPASSEERTRDEVAQLSPEPSARSCSADLVGERANRRHRPGRGFEALRYRFEIVSDYGAFRDLQRHRMLTVQWQGLTPDLGAGVPDEVVEAGAGDLYARALERSEEEYERLAAAGLRDAAPYALCLGFRIRYVLDLNAREAMHTIELRSGREGHPSYRAVAHEMHAQIAALHPAVAAAMTHVDTSTEPRLERILSEMRTERRALSPRLVPLVRPRRQRARRRRRAARASSRPSEEAAPRWSTRIAWMAGLAALLDVPAVVVEEGPERNGPPTRASSSALPAGTPVIEKPTFGLAAHEAAVDAIRATGRGTAVLVGFETDVCVAQSAIGLLAVRLPRRRARGRDVHEQRARARARARAHDRHRRRAQPLQGPDLRVAAHRRPRARGLPGRAGARHAALAPLVSPVGHRHAHAVVALLGPEPSARRAVAAPARGWRPPRVRRARRRRRGTGRASAAACRPGRRAAGSCAAPCPTACRTGPVL